MRNNQSIQVGAESISGLLAGILAGAMLSLPLMFLACVSLLASFMLYFHQSALHSQT